MDEASVAVAGGGLAGLVAARHLADAGAEVTLFERNDEVGGRVRSVRRDGFVFDRGFQVLFDAYPAARRELRYRELDLQAFAPGAVICKDGQRSTLSDPLGDLSALTESLFNRRVTTGDKVRTLRLRRELKGRSADDVFSGPDVSIREYLRERGFSRRFVENFAAPFYGGITLDRSLSTSGRVFEYTFGRLGAGRTVVPAAGMGAIPAQLADRARRSGAAVETGATVESVDAAVGDGGTAGNPTPGVAVAVGGETVEFDAAVVATDPQTARELTDVAAVPTDARGCVTQFYALDTPLSVGKRILLNADDPAPNEVVPNSAVAPDHAPADTHLVSATFLADAGGRADGSAALDEPPLEADAADLAARTRAKLGEWFPERRFDGLDPVHTERVPFAQFDQPPGIHDDLPDPRDPAGAVYLAGDYTRWSSIQGALESGRDAARAVVADLDLGP